MADKEIHELDPSGADLQDTDVIAGVVGTADADKYTGAQVRAVEQGERETQDDVIENSAGFNADGTYNGFAGSNFLDASTSVRDALSRLDTAIGNIALTTNGRVGTETLVADTPLVVVFKIGGIATPYADTDYIIPTRHSYNAGGSQIPVKISNKTVNGFTVVCNFNSTYEYRADHL